MPTYLVMQSFYQTAEAAEGKNRERLIEAPTKAAAIRKVADETISAALAETADIVRLARAGVELERAE